MCTVLLPPCVNPTAVDKYIILHVLVFVTLPSGRSMCYLLKNYTLFAMFLHRVCCKM